VKHIPHLYVPRPWDGSRLGLEESQTRHLSKVLRVVPDAPLSYTDGEGTTGFGVWNGSSLERGEENEVVRPSNLVMAVAPPASKDRLRFVVEKLGELGVQSLVWLRTSNGNTRVPSVGKQRQWAVSALEQSRGSWLMKVAEGIADWPSLPTPLVVCRPGGSDTVNSPSTVVVGPEGGLDDSEIPAQAGFFDLGPTILRVETAAVVAAAKFR
jgi:16S rRNA (uracil1498-N3)-methyltransferase